MLRVFPNARLGRVFSSTFQIRPSGLQKHKSLALWGRMPRSWSRTGHLLTSISLLWLKMPLLVRQGSLLSFHQVISVVSSLGGPADSIEVLTATTPSGHLVVGQTAFLRVLWCAWIPEQTTCIGVKSRYTRTLGSKIGLEEWVPSDSSSLPTQASKTGVFGK
jgi:hypothetical protein